MRTLYDTSLPPHLRVLKEEIEGYAREYGLDFYETIFEVVDADDVNEIAAYGGFPTRYPHWSYGMAYEELRKGYDYGLSKIYEMVINNDPCYAYLMRSNHVVDQKLVMAHVYGHCLAPETKVECRGGVKRIDEIAPGEDVLTHRGHYRPVTARGRRWFDGEIVTLRVSGSNETVQVTAEHPVLAVRSAGCVLAGRQAVACRPTCQTQHKCSSPRPYEGYEPTWIPAGEVRAGDVLLFPRRCASDDPVPAVEIPFDKVLHRRRRIGRHVIPVSADLALLIGYFIAEGNAQPRGLVGFGFHRSESAYHEEVARLVRGVFGLRVGQDASHCSLATTVRFNNLEVARWLREQVGTAADRKRIPEFLYDHPDAGLALQVLRGVFNGDGTFSRSPGREAGQLSVTTISETLAYQLRHLCLRWGIRTQIAVRSRVNRRPAYEVIWSGVSAHCLSTLLLGEDVVAGNRSFERAWTDDQYLFQQVKEAGRKPYVGYVYNFSVQEDESYTLAAGFAVHNCDFFKNNAYFAHTSRKMMDEMANHGTRIRGYVEKFGEDEVEGFLDRCMSIDDLIDIHSTAIRRREPANRYDFGPDQDDSAEVRPTRFKSKDYMDAYINPQDLLKAEEEERRKVLEQQARSFPEQPEKDVLLFLIENAPLKIWQRDILSIIRDEAYYFAPQGQTKIMNEGWACVDANALVLTDEGLRRMGGLVAGRSPVAVHDGKNSQRVYDWASFADRQTVTIQTRRGLELTGSNTHQIRLPDGSWKRMDELAVGDRLEIARGTNLWADQPVRLSWAPSCRLTLNEVAAGAGVSSDTVLRHREGRRTRSTAGLTPLPQEYDRDLAGKSFRLNKRRQGTIPEVADQRFASFLGYLIGDGHISDVKRVVGLTTGDREQAEHFARLAEEVFGITPRIKWGRTKWRVLFSSGMIQEFLTHLGLKTGRCAREKTVPDVILRSPKSVVTAFLRAFYDCDGYAGKAGVILSTSSTEMSKVVQLLLLNFGILSTRRPHKDSCWHVHTMGKSAEIFRDVIGFGLQRKQDKLDEYIDSHQWFCREEDDEIVSIEHGRGDVYDISVENTHRYVAQGFVNHNSYWHSTIMTQKVLQPSEVIDYADHHSGTMAMSGGRLNPYKVGIELLRDIEHRWNTGKFGKEYDECEDLEKKKRWDTGLGLGRQKIFEVRKIHNDITFIDTFLTPEFCVEHNLFSFAWHEQAGQYIIESREFNKIKQRLLFSLTNFGKPWIYVVDGNYRNRGELLLKHHHTGVELRLDQAADTLANIQYIWSRPVHLQTIVDGKPTMLSFDGTDHSIRTGGEVDDSRRSTPARTR